MAAKRSTATNSGGQEKRTKEEALEYTGVRRSGGGCDTGRKDKLANNEDGKESWEYTVSVCTISSYR